jgi:hypothetical protein
MHRASLVVSSSDVLGRSRSAAVHSDDNAVRPAGRHYPHNGLAQTIERSGAPGPARHQNVSSDHVNLRESFASHDVTVVSFAICARLGAMGERASVLAYCMASAVYTNGALHG